MATLTQLRVALRTRLAFGDKTDSSNGSLDQTGATSLLNAAMRRIYAACWTQCPDIFTKQTTLTYTANAESVALPSSSPDLRGRPIREVAALLTAGSSDPSERRVLKAITQPEMSIYDGLNDPMVYALGLADYTIWLRPVPTADATLYLKYIPGIADLSGSSDTPTFLPSEFHDVIVDEAAVEYLESSGDVQLQATVLRARDRKLQRALAAFDDMHTASGFRHMP